MLPMCPEWTVLLLTMFAECLPTAENRLTLVTQLKAGKL